jgi:RHS repeat-associated protein
LRVKKVAGATTTRYIFSGTKAVAEYEGASPNPASPTREYIYSGSALLATIEGSTTTYHHQDHLSVRLTTDAQGTKIGEQGNYPFGEFWYSSSTTTKWRFTSYERDAESGNDYAIFRYHSNRLGRFLTPDPLAGTVADPQSLNRYSYVGNDPINRTDPTGLLSLANDWFWILFSAETPGSLYRRGGGAINDWIVDSEMRETFGYGYWDLPGYHDEIAQETYRYESIMTAGFDPATGQWTGTTCTVASFDQLGTANRTAQQTLTNSNGGNVQAAAAQYASWTPYQQAVFLNTTAAAAATQGAVLGQATFAGWVGSANTPYGVTLGNVNSAGNLTAFGGSFRSPSNVLRGGVEASALSGTVSFDVDLWNPNSIAAPLHGLEVLGNWLSGNSTHPADVARALNSRRVSTGVYCK